MNTYSSKSRLGAFGAVELIVVFCVLFCIAALLLPALAKARARASKVSCLSSLKQVGLGFRMWADDHEEKFPWAVSTTQGGSMEFANSRDVFLHFLVASNELISPKVLVCSDDKGRKGTPYWSDLNNMRISYFVGLNADKSKPEMILSGDRTISTNNRMVSGFLTLSSNSPVRWAKGIHTNYGNVGFADGSAQRMDESAWTNFVQWDTRWRTNLWPMSLAIP